MGCEEAELLSLVVVVVVVVGALLEKQLPSCVCCWLVLYVIRPSAVTLNMILQLNQFPWDAVSLGYYISLTYY